MDARAKCDSLRDMKHGTWAQWHSLGKSSLKDSRFGGCYDDGLYGTRRSPIYGLGEWSERVGKGAPSIRNVASNEMLSQRDTRQQPACGG